MMINGILTQNIEFNYQWYYGVNKILNKLFRILFYVFQSVYFVMLVCNVFQSLNAKLI